MAWLEKRSGKYRICYREGGRIKRIAAYADKLASKAKLVELERARARGEQGLVDPFGEHKTREIRGHLGDYVGDLRSLGRNATYVYHADKRLHRLISECGWRILDDISADSFCNWRSRPVLSRQVTKEVETGSRQVSPRTLNQYLMTAKAFCHWCVRRERMKSNPLAHVAKVVEVADVRRERRALSEEEIARLLAAVPDRLRQVYRFILATGLRRSETAMLQWGDLRLEPSHPVIKLRASVTKSRRADELPLRADLAEELRFARGEASDVDRVFESVPSVAQHREFLAAAGIDWTDSQGRRADIHSLRKTFNTHLLKAGVLLRVAQELMRHTTPLLTAKAYTDPRIFDLAGAVEKVPLPSIAQQARQSSTGSVGPIDRTREGTTEGAHRVAAATLMRHGTALCGVETQQRSHSITPDSDNVKHALATSDSMRGKMRHVGLEP